MTTITEKIEFIPHEQIDSMYRTYECNSRQRENLKRVEIIMKFGKAPHRVIDMIDTHVKFKEDSIEISTWINEEKE